MDVIVLNSEMSHEEQQYYVRYITEKYPSIPIEKIFLDIDDDYVNINVIPRKRFLAKLNGSLISDPLTWNNAKRAEYFDTLSNFIDLDK